MQTHRIQKRPAPRWAGAGAIECHLVGSRSKLWWIEAGSGPPLVLLHGYSGGARWWQRNISALTDLRRVYLLELPGFSRSALRQRFSLELALEIVVRWLDVLDLRRVDLIGHSMGGLLALLLAAQHPERVCALVLYAPAGLPMAQTLPALLWRATLSRRGGDAQFSAIVAAAALRTGPRILWQAAQQVRKTDIRPLLQAVRAPTLVLWGDRDALLPPANGTLLLEQLAQARLVVVAGAGHSLMFENSAIVNRETRAFLSSTLVLEER